MAFDRPLEADRVDDLGLLSSFVRAPIVGPIMWMLGGQMAKEMDDDKPDLESTIMRGVSEIDEDADMEDADQDSISDAATPATLCQQIGNDKKPPPPGVVKASDGDFDGSSSEDEDGGGLALQVRGMAALSVSERGTSGSPARLSRTNRMQRFGRGSRKMSWSDESGQDLVKYESQTAPHNPSNPDLSAKPMKSAMKKTGSYGGAGGRGGEGGGSTGRLNPSKCLPSGFGKGGGIVMPTGGGMAMPSYHLPSSSTTAISRDSNNGSAGSGNGNFSPQWGWYISTTPPTPEKYFAAPPGSKGKSKPAGERPLGIPESQPAEHPAPVFTSNPSPVFKKGGVPTTMGWPSVPL